MSLKRWRKYWKKVPINEAELPKLLVQASVLEFLKRMASESHQAETGGILIGFHRGTDILITRASDAGPKALKSSCSVLRDTEHCRAVLEQEFSSTGADYVGEWHTHVVDLPHPSTGDLRTLAGIMMDPDYDFQSFGMILVNKHLDDSCRLSGYLAIRKEATLVQVNEVPIVSSDT